MKHYLKHGDNSLWAFEDDGSQDHLITEDMDQLSADQLAALRAPPPPTPEEVQAQFVTIIQSRLDAFAQTRAYDGILSACTYATDPDPAFAAEGQRCVELRGQTWRAAYALLKEVRAGTRPVPQSIADIDADLPPLAWSEAQP